MTGAPAVGVVVWVVPLCGQPAGRYVTPYLSPHEDNRCRRCARIEAEGRADERREIVGVRLRYVLDRHDDVVHNEVMFGMTAIAEDDWHDTSEAPMWDYDPEGWSELTTADQREYRDEWERLNAAGF